MYIDGFHFSPFQIQGNVVSVWAGEVIIKKGEILHVKRGERPKKITPEEFYDMYTTYMKDAWCTPDFIEAFREHKQAIPSWITEFAVYKQFKLTCLVKQVIANRKRQKSNNIKLTDLLKP